MPPVSMPKYGRHSKLLRSDSRLNALPLDPKAIMLVYFLSKYEKMQQNSNDAKINIDKQTDDALMF